MYFYYFFYNEVLSLVFFKGKKKPRSPEAQKPRSPEAQKPRSPEAQKPRSPEAQKPRSPEAQKPRSPEAQKPRSPEAQKPRSPEAQKPRSPEAQKPRSPEAQKKGYSNKEKAVSYPLGIPYPLSLIPSMRSFYLCEYRLVSFRWLKTKARVYAKPSLLKSKIRDTKSILLFKIEDFNKPLFE